MYDIAVIGGGVVGGTILRELTKYRLKVVLLEKESDVCMGASKANSGIVHAGFDAIEGTNKAKFNVRGSQMMKKYAADLGVKYINNGSIVTAFNEKEKNTLFELLRRGRNNGVKGLKIISAHKLKKMEPNVSDDVICALYAKTGAIICPYELTVACIGNAMDNGAELMLNFEVVRVLQGNGYFDITSAKGKTISAKIIINAAGAGAQKIAELCGDDTVRIGYRRGEYVLLDRESRGLVSHTLFFTPTEITKGVLITNTVDGNILIGPNAEEISEVKTETTFSGLKKVMTKAATLIKNIPFYNTITSFAGVRAYSADTHDFIVEKSGKVEGLINVCGTESPGLSCAPAIAEYVVQELLPKRFTRLHNTDFIGKRRPDYYFKNLSRRKKNKIIKRNPAYGNIVCRCEQITEGEIEEAIRRNPKATTIDGIKLRTRSGMGRCQGGFCQPRVAEILSRELGIDTEEITKSGEGSNILTGRSK